MELANDDATMEMEHRTTYLATVGTLGPMIGLVGTVYGMIVSLPGHRQRAGRYPRRAELAAGSHDAVRDPRGNRDLATGDRSSTPMYRNRIARLSLEVGVTAEPLLDQFGPGVRSVATTSASNYGPAPTPPAHPHPFALSATLAATGASAARPALPSAD